MNANFKEVETFVFLNDLGNFKEGSPLSASNPTKVFAGDGESHQLINHQFSWS